jgi:hypothetical protein
MLLCLAAQALSASGPSLPHLRLGGLAWADYNGDNLPDLLTFGLDSTGTRRSYLLTNSGTALTLNASQALTGLSQGDAAWADLDNDGDQDLAMSGENNAGQPTTQLYRNNAGTLSAIATGLPGLIGGRIAWADFDQDGLRDLVLTGYNPQRGYLGVIARNQGAGQFTIVNTGSIASRDHTCLAVGDFNNDGKPDIAFADTSPRLSEGSRVVVLRNNGGFIFEAMPSVIPVFSDGSMEFGDADGDGDLDLLCAGQVGVPVLDVFPWTAGQFQTIGAGLTPIALGEARFLDADGDGDLDIASAGFVGQVLQTLIYRKTPTGYTLMQAAANLPALYHTRIAAADWNGDGYKDFALLGQTASDQARCYLLTYNATLNRYEL